MKRGIFQEFDGYNRIVEEIEISRRYGIDYTREKDSPDQYINLLHPPRLDLCVSEIIEETRSAKTLRLVSPEHYLPPFQAGQYISISLEIGKIRTTRPYSISSPPNQIGYYDITVKRVDGGLVSNYLLDKLRVGHLLESSGPTGNFYYNPLFHDQTMVCIAGGSGITPFMSMIRQVVECGLDRTVYLFYGNKVLDDAIFHEALRGISERSEKIHYFPVVENPDERYKAHTGLITGSLIRETLGGLADKTFYLCGPQGLYDFCIPELKNLGIPDRKIRKEAFGAPENICDCPDWPQEIRRDDVFTVRVNPVRELCSLTSIDGGIKPPSIRNYLYHRQESVAFSNGVNNEKTIKVRAGEPLIVALEKEGLGVPSLCRSGECSKCRVKVLSGKVFQPPGALVRKSDRQFGYIHSCVSYPLEDLSILL